MSGKENKRQPRLEQSNYHYYTTYPLDIGTFPKTPGGPVKLEPFDKRQPVEGGTFRAWGVLTYNEPLTDRQVDDYELRPASGNPKVTDKAHGQELTPSIADQLAEGAARAARDSATRPAPDKHKDIDR